MERDAKYVRLADHVSLRLLEEPFIYDRRADELYEINQEGLEALRRCRGQITLVQAGLEPEFARVCLEEGLLVLSDEPEPRPLTLGPGPSPSLRYLELQITWRCNLACRHCYLGPAQAQDMAVETVAALAREFEAMGGLRLMISGGEPLMHPAWPQVNAVLAALPVRRVLLSNGLLLTPEVLKGLNCDEVQISLDGAKKGHEMLRGAGNYDKALAAARAVTASGRDLSIATMAHADNLDEFDELARVVRDLGADEWGIDAPCISGRLAEHQELAISPHQAAEAMSHAYGGSFHGGGDGMACGLHLCTVAADGRVAQCGFYLDEPLGLAREGLWTCWARRKPLSLNELPQCRDCQAAEECSGGCRFRAPHRLAPDPVMCAAYGMDAPATSKEES